VVGREENIEDPVLVVVVEEFIVTSLLVVVEEFIVVSLLVLDVVMCISFG
jgi:hypothetical protein